MESFPPLPEGTIRIAIDSCPKDFAPQGVFRRLALRAVVYREGRLLMVRSAAVGDWKFPGGGLEPGETPEEALAREVAEETGHRLLSLTGPLIAADELRLGREPGKAMEMRSLYYLCEVDGEAGETDLDDYERELGFEASFVNPGEALRANRAIQSDSSVPNPAWLLREIRVLQTLRRMALNRKPGRFSPAEAATLTLFSPRLILEPLSKAHREEVFASFTPEVARYMYPAPARDISETDSFIAEADEDRRSGRGLQFALRSREDGSFLGCLGLHAVDSPLPEVGLWLRREAWGRGLGSEAAGCLLQWARSRLPARFYRYPADRRNLASCAVARKEGGLPYREYRCQGLGGNDLDQIEYLLPRSPLPMPPAPSLAPFGRWCEGPGGEPLFLYDTRPFATERGLEEENPVFILVHGLGDEADSWRSLLPLLSAKGFRAAAPDLPGFGRSPAAGRVSMKTHAEALASVIRFVRATGGGQRKIFLAGSSLGAAVCELACAQVGNEVSGLAFLDGGLPTAEKIDPRLFLAFLPGLGERRYRAYREDPEAAFRSLSPYYWNLEALPLEDRDFLRKRVMARVGSESQMKAYYQSFRSYLLTALAGRPAFRRLLKNQAGRGCRFFALWGAADRILSLRGSSALKETLRKAGSDVTWREMPDTGHLPHQERPSEVAQALAEWAKP